MTRQRPQGLPEKAIFDDVEHCWALGEKDRQGRRIGAWISWREDGTKEGEENWGDGATRMTYRRFHPDGTESQSGEKDLKNDVWAGVMRWTKLDEESVEDRFWPPAPENARTFEVVFNDKGHVVTERMFDGGGARLSASGAAVPARPPSVDENAILVDRDRRWLSAERTLDGAKHFGTYRVWDRNGTLLEQRSYDDHGKVTREEKYENGALSSTKDHDGDELVQSFYRTRDGKTVIKSRTLYRNDQTDRREAHYDEEGMPLYSVREEQVSESHARRYDDDVLVFEAKWSPDADRAPELKYFDGDKVLVDYASHGDGTGTFTLYRRDGSVEATLDIDDEADNSEYGNWDTFLPGFARYEADRKQTDVEHVRADFLARVDQQGFETAVAQLIVPPHLQAIHDVDWTNARSADRKAKLDKLLVMMLGDDARSAKRARDAIWGAIEQQDCLFDSTYDVALTLTRVLPSVPAEAQQRAVKELAGIVCLAGMPHEEPERYAELLKEVRAHVPFLEAFARSHDDDDGRAVLHLLSVVNAPAVMRERLVDAKASMQTRAFAACALSACRGQSKEQRDEAVATLEQTFLNDDDTAVRAILGVLVSLMRGGKGARSRAIDALLLRYIVQPDRQAELFDAWRPVIGFLGDDVAAMLYRAVPEEIRLQHIDLVIDGLRKRDRLEQVDDLDIIFATLFAAGPKTDLSPLHEKALLAVANVVDENTGFVNQGEIFRKHGLPWDSFALRELAGRVGSAGDVTP
jgi:hypothetical protein